MFLTHDYHKDFKTLKSSIYQLNKTLKTSNSRITKLTWILVVLTLITAGLILIQVLN